MGPGLAPGMTDVEVFERLNAWGVARDSELVDLRASLASTQNIVDATFVEARGMLLTIVHEFRREAEVSRSHGAYEAAQSLACLERVVAEARARFDAQDAKFTQDLGELARRVAAPTAAVFQAAPAPPWLVTSPGGTIRFAPGGPVGGVVLPPAPEAGFTTPQRPAPQQQQQQQQNQQQQPQQQTQPTQPTTTTHDAWGPWAAARGVSPQRQSSHHQGGSLGG